MALATPQELEEEMRVLVRNQLPEADSETVAYISRLFSTARMPGWEEIRLNWMGLQKEIPAEYDKNRILTEKLDHSKMVGDSCLTLCTFYREDNGHKGIIAMPMPAEEPSRTKVVSTDKRKFAGEHEPTPPNKPLRFGNKSPTPGLELMPLGKAGYRIAGFYSAALGKEDSHVYPAISQRFPQIIARLGPPILRDYLGDLNPPQRIVVYTPHGEMLFRLRTSQN